MEKNYNQALAHLEAESKKSENVGSRVIQDFLKAIKDKEGFRLEDLKLLSPKNFAACMVLLQHEHSSFAEHVCGQDLTSHKATMGRTKNGMKGSVGTVEELIKKLQEFDRSKEIIFYDDAKATPFEIEDISSLDIERTRDAKGFPRLKSGKSDVSINAVVVQITSDI